MGNSYSVAREEREEEEFLSLVEAVEIAQQRSVQQNDVEMGLGHSFHTAHRRGHGLAPDRPEQDKVSRGERYQQALERPEWNIASQPEATVIPTAAVVMDTRGQSRSPASRHEPIGFSADCASSLNESLIPPPPVIMATPAACQLPILIQPAPLAPAPPTQWPGAVTASCLPTIPAVVRVQTIESPTLGSPEEEVPTLAMPEVSSSPLSPATVMGESIPEQPALSSFHQVIRPITLSESSSSPHSPSSTPSSLPHSVQSSRSRSRSRSPRRSQTSPTPIIITNASIHSRYSSTRYRPISQPATATPVPIPQEAGPATPRHYPAHSQSPSFGAARYRRSPERPLERSRYHSPRRSHAFGWGSHCPSPERYRTRPSSRVARHSYYAAPRRQRSRESAQSKPRSPSQVDEARGRDTAPSPLRSSRDGDRPLRTSVAGLSYGRDPMNNISAVNIEGVVSVHPVCSRPASCSEDGDQRLPYLYSRSRPRLRSQSPRSRSRDSYRGRRFLSPSRHPHPRSRSFNRYYDPYGQEWSVYRQRRFRRYYSPRPPRRHFPWRPALSRSPSIARSRSHSLEHRPRRSWSLERTRYERLLDAHEVCLAEHAARTTQWQEQTKHLSLVLRGVEKQLVLLRHGHGEAFSSTASLTLSQAAHEKEVFMMDDKGLGGSSDVDEKARTMASAGTVPVVARPYPNRPYAVGLRAVRRCSDDWSPPWHVFPLKAFRGSNYTYLKIRAHWDDEDLLKELSRSYDKLRTVWRKWFSLRSVRSITMVYADHTFVYPRRLGPAGVNPSKNMRLRYFLHHPQQMKGRHEFMQVLTARTDLGIEFVEGWQLMRISVAILIPVIASLILGVLYSVFAGQVSDAFTIAGYMTSAYSVCLVLLGLLNFVEF